MKALKNINRIQLRNETLIILLDLYESKGKGTRIFSNLRKGDRLEILGPLGNGFDLASKGRTAIVGGGIGIAPGANINYETGRAIFEATHGTAPDIAGKDIVNPLSLLLSAEMMLRYLGWSEASDLILNSVNKTIKQKSVTKDFYTLMEGDDKQLLTTSAFGKALITNF